MTRRHYAVAEVEALIPALERTFTQILQLRVGLRAIEQKLERAGVRVDLDEDGGGETPGRTRGQDGDHDMLGKIEGRQAVETPQVRHARAVFRGFYEALSDALEQIRALGGDVKDLDMGLVDFPGRRGSEDILLCWRLGEKRIEYWHPVDSGFASRRPLDERIPRTPSRWD